MFRKRLNPFEFRAGIQSSMLVSIVRGVGLNPFEFRAGIQSAADGVPAYSK